MKPTLNYRPEVTDDLDVAVRWYESRQAGLGSRFITEVEEYIDRIHAHPLIYGVFQDDVRVAPLKTFPYVIYYRVDGTQLFILAVRHGKRSLRGLRGRL